MLVADGRQLLRTNVEHIISNIGALKPSDDNVGSMDLGHYLTPEPPPAFTMSQGDQSFLLALDDDDLIPDPPQLSSGAHSGACSTESPDEDSVQSMNDGGDDQNETAEDVEAQVNVSFVNTDLQAGDGDNGGFIEPRAALSKPQHMDHHEGNHEDTALQSDLMEVDAELPVNAGYEAAGGFQSSGVGVSSCRAPTGEVAVAEPRDNMGIEALNAKLFEDSDDEDAPNASNDQEQSAGGGVSPCRASSESGIDDRMEVAAEPRDNVQSEAVIDELLEVSDDDAPNASSASSSKASKKRRHKKKKPRMEEDDEAAAAKKKAKPNHIRSVHVSSRLSNSGTKDPKKIVDVAMHYCRGIIPKGTGSSWVLFVDLGSTRSKILMTLVNYDDGSVTKRTAPITFVWSHTFAINARTLVNRVLATNESRLKFHRVTSNSLKAAKLTWNDYWGDEIRGLYSTKGCCRFLGDGNDATAQADEILIVDAKGKALIQSDMEKEWSDVLLGVNDVMTFQRFLHRVTPADDASNELGIPFSSVFVVFRDVKVQVPKGDKIVEEDFHLSYDVMLCLLVMRMCHDSFLPSRVHNPDRVVFTTPKEMTPVEQHSFKQMFEVALVYVQKVLEKDPGLSSREGTVLKTPAGVAKIPIHPMYESDVVNEFAMHDIAPDVKKCYVISMDLGGKTNHICVRMRNLVTGDTTLIGNIMIPSGVNDIMLYTLLLVSKFSFPSVYGRTLEELMLNIDTWLPAITEVICSAINRQDTGGNMGTLVDEELDNVDFWSLRQAMGTQFTFHWGMLWQVFAVHLVKAFRLLEMHKLLLVVDGDEEEVPIILHYAGAISTTKWFPPFAKSIVRRIFDDDIYRRIRFQFQPCGDLHHSDDHASCLGMLMAHHRRLSKGQLCLFDNTPFDNQGLKWKEYETRWATVKSSVADRPLGFIVVIISEPQTTAVNDDTNLMQQQMYDIPAIDSKRHRWIKEHYVDLDKMGPHLVVNQVKAAQEDLIFVDSRVLIVAHDFLKTPVNTVEYDGASIIINDTEYMSDTDRRVVVLDEITPGVFSGLYQLVVKAMFVDDNPDAILPHPLDGIRSILHTEIYAINKTIFFTKSVPEQTVRLSCLQNLLEKILLPLVAHQQQLNWRVWFLPRQPSAVVIDHYSSLMNIVPISASSSMGLRYMCGHRPMAYQKNGKEISMQEKQALFGDRPVVVEVYEDVVDDDGTVVRSKWLMCGNRREEEFAAYKAYSANEHAFWGSGSTRTVPEKYIRDDLSIDPKECMVKLQSVTEMDE